MNEPNGGHEIEEERKHFLIFISFLSIKQKRKNPLIFLYRQRLKTELVLKK